MKMFTLLLSFTLFHPMQASWIMQCAQKGLVGNSNQDQPIRGSLSDALLTCMVDHATTALYVTDKLVVFPTGEEWCLPDDFLSEEQTCASLLFDVFEPLRHCIQEDDFPALSSDPRYRAGFNESVDAENQSSFYLSSKLSLAMCELLEALRSDRGIDCLLDFCRNASHSPSLEPSPNPSSIPSLFPSMEPTFTPSLAPSGQPSTFPSSIPTSFPSGQPTLSEPPTTADTETPSFGPSVEPSLEPSSSPSAKPIENFKEGTWLRTKTTLRVFLDGVGELQLPPPETFNTALEAAFKDVLLPIEGFQHVEVASFSRAPVPENSPLVVSLRIIVIRSCTDMDCFDPFAGTSVGAEVRDTFEESIIDQSLKDAIRQSDAAGEMTSLLDAIPRENSANLMSVSSYLINEEPDNEKPRVTSSSYTSNLGASFALSVLLAFAA